MLDTKETPCQTIRVASDLLLLKLRGGRFVRYEKGQTLTIGADMANGLIRDGLATPEKFDRSALPPTPPKRAYRTADASSPSRTAALDVGKE